NDVIAGGTAEHDKVEQRVRTQAVGTMNRRGSTFAHRVQTLNRHVLAIAPIHHLTINIGGQTTHLVVNGGNDGDRVLDRINVAELDGNFTDRGQTLHDGFGADVIQLEQDVIAVGATRSEEHTSELQSR